MVVSRRQWSLGNPQSVNVDPKVNGELANT
jgi:hypothetical protein